MLFLFEVTAADWNGRSFDGSPFSYVGRYLKETKTVSSITAELAEDVNSLQIAVAKAIDSGKLKIHTQGGSDYAQWRVFDDNGGHLDYGPGDYVLVMSETTLLWIPGNVIAALGILGKSAT